MKLLLILMTAGTLVACEVISLNNEVDEMLEVVKRELKVSNESQVILPDIALAYEKNILFFNFKLQLRGTNGSVKNLTTVRRKDNITIISSDYSLLVRLNFGFNDLLIKYNYTAEFMWLKIGGVFNVNLSEQSVAIELGINVTEDRCSGVIDVKSVTFTLYQGIAASISGFGYLNSLMSTIVTHSLLDISESVKKSIEDIFTLKLQDNIRTFNMCGSEAKEKIYKFLSTNVTNLYAPEFINLILNQNNNNEHGGDTL